MAPYGVWIHQVHVQYSMYIASYFLIFTCMTHSTNRSTSLFLCYFIKFLMWTFKVCTIVRFVYMCTSIFVNICRDLLYVMFICQDSSKNVYLCASMYIYILLYSPFQSQLEWISSIFFHCSFSKCYLYEANIHYAYN